MSELGIIRELGKEVLKIPTADGCLDTFLWDRAERLLRNVELICELPELGKRGLQIDRFCLEAATHFSDAGLAEYIRSGDSVESGLGNHNSGKLLELCTQIVEEKLKTHIVGAQIEKINSIIIESSQRCPQKVEAMVLRDARCLDDMGAVGIFNEFKRLMVRGKSAADAVQSWQRKVDYRYWQARLKEDFGFESVRRLAEERLAASEHFMNQLRAETEAEDLKNLTVELLEVSDN